MKKIIRWFVVLLIPGMILAISIIVSLVIYRYRAYIATETALSTAPLAVIRAGDLNVPAIGTGNSFTTRIGPIELAALTREQTLKSGLPSLAGLEQKRVAVAAASKERNAHQEQQAKATDHEKTLKELSERLKNSSEKLAELRKKRQAAETTERIVKAKAVLNQATGKFNKYQRDLRAAESRRQGIESDLRVAEKRLTELCDGKNEAVVIFKLQDDIDKGREQLKLLVTTAERSSHKIRIDRKTLQLSEIKSNQRILPEKERQRQECVLEIAKLRDGEQKALNARRFAESVYNLQLTESSSLIDEIAVLEAQIKGDSATFSTLSKSSEADVKALAH